MIRYTRCRIQTTIVAEHRKGEQMNDFARKVKDQMIKYGFTAPDMTVTEFVEDILPTISKTESVECEDAISRKGAIEAVTEYGSGDTTYLSVGELKRRLEKLPSTQPEIIRCSSCKYWTQTVGKMKGYGLGRCDFHDANLVACNGFCYWAERREE